LKNHDQRLQSEIKPGEVMKRILIISTLFVLSVALSGCAGGKAGGAGAQYGKPIPKEMVVTSTGAITDNPKDFEGKDVLVQGKITSECPSGCWFWVHDASGDMYVDINPSGLFIPQKVGSTVRVMGTVILNQDRPQVVGTGIEF
jgi:uncharacterized protein YdeI (BOF family)